MSLKELNDAYCVISHNSSPGVVSAIEGVPIFLLDPERSQAKEVANVNLSNIENPRYYTPRETVTIWLNTVCNNQFTLQEIEDGVAYDMLKEQYA